jgi:hypothetical protein
MALTGFVFTSRPWLNWLGKFQPEKGIIIKNAVALGLIFLMHLVDPSISLPHLRALGVFLIYVAFMMIFNYQSDWIQESGSDDVGDQTVDGGIYHRARTTLNLGPEMARLLTFVIVPFLLVFAGSRLVKNGQKMRLD